MNDVVIGAIGGYQFSQIKNWIYSLNSTSFDGDRIMLCYGCSKELVDQIKENGFEVFEITWDGLGQPLSPPNDLVTHTGLVTRENAYRLIHNLRFFHIWQLLSQFEKDGKKYDRVITTDVRDVIFQGNPTDWLDAYQEKPIIAPSESVMYEDEGWNMKNFISGLGGVSWEYLGKDLLVCNVGTIAGTYEEFKELCFMIYTMSVGNWVADQSMFNILINTSYKDKTQVVTPDDYWACQTGTLVESYDKLKNVLLDKPPYMGMDGLVRNSKDDVFCLVHQYERIPEWNKIVEKKYPL